MIFSQKLLKKKPSRVKLALQKSPAKFQNPEIVEKIIFSISLQHMINVQNIPFTWVFGEPTVFLSI